MFITFLEIHLWITENIKNYIIYRKPTNTFSYLNYNNCHHVRTENNISLSMATRVARVVSEARIDTHDNFKIHKKYN